MLFSIIIPLYNKEQSIVSTLQTVLKQTFQDFEIVIVDDGSTDHSVEEVKKVIDPRIRLIHQSNAGVSAARNRGIDEARGEYIAFLDADDEWKPDYLKTQYELVQKYPECNVFACNYEFKDTQEKVKPTIIRKLPFKGEDGILSNYFEVASCSHPPLWTSAVMVKKSAIQSIDGFPVGIKSGEDLLTWARLACRYFIVFYTIPLATFIFDEQHFNEDQRKRMPEEIDYVGSELAKLYKKHRHIIGLKNYVGLWHKMRARIFMSKHNRKKALYECIYALRYSITIKIIIFLLLSLMPYRFINYVFKKVK